MRDTWEQTTLGELCYLTKGATATQKAMPGEYPLVVTAERRASSADYQFDVPAVCVPMVSSTGHGHASLKRVHYQDGKFSVANIITACTARAERPVDMKFLWLKLDHERDELIVPRMKGTANVSLSQRALAGVPINLPPLPEQRRIVDLIDALDDAIAKAEQAAVDTSSLRDRALVVEMAGAGGEEIPLGDVVEHTIGGTWGKDPGQSDVEVISFGTKAYAHRAQNLDPSSGAPRSISSRQYAQRQLQRGDIILEVSGGSENQAVGRTLYVAEDMPHVIPSSFMRLLRFDHSRVDPQWARHLMRLLYVNGTTERLQSNTTSIRNLNVPGLLEEAIIVPTLQRQASMVEFFDALDDAVHHADSVIDHLRNLRANLLTALLSGEHEMPETYDELMEPGS